MTTEPIVALDYFTLGDALSMVRTLGGLCRFYKIGSELFTAVGPAAVAAVRGLGCDVFLDLKFHDIPDTVRAAVRTAASHGVRLVTVHASGGRVMLEAAVEGAGRYQPCGVVAVTVLTSLTADVLGAAWGRPVVAVADDVMRLAGIAADAGAHGIVCSGEEAPAARARYGDRLALVVPGVRLAGGPAHDQARVVTPAAARAAGARYVVIGRTVTAAPDPCAAMAAVVEELAGA
ncbi:MAG: orotidine-5'-phosphate decarboxylase [Gemmatimonadota bacterium]|nr:orotidine-5'-phosphate decarboxylase [Gemmatimonadota bacterium]